MIANEVISSIPGDRGREIPAFFRFLSSGHFWNFLQEVKGCNLKHFFHFSGSWVFHQKMLQRDDTQPKKVKVIFVTQLHPVSFNKVWGIIWGVGNEEPAWGTEEEPSKSHVPSEPAIPNLVSSSSHWLEMKGAMVQRHCTTSKFTATFGKCKFSLVVPPSKICFGFQLFWYTIKWEGHRNVL